jgi:uncharacterized protein (DUF2141 family)
MKAFWLFVLLAAPLHLWSQNILEVQVEGVESSDGLIQVALFTSRDGFLKTTGAYRTDSVKALKGTTRLLLDNLPPGTYALALFHDKNQNLKLDTNWIGIPKEPMGFSNARMKTFGPPSFEECRVDFRENGTISIRLE